MITADAPSFRLATAQRRAILCDSIVAVWSLVAALSLLAGLPGCDGNRRANGAATDLDAQGYNPGGWYGDADAAVGDTVGWDALTGSADAIAVATDGSAVALPGAIALPCGGASAKPNGTCCPAGQGWNQQAQACQGFSLAECPVPATCAPKWCADWKGATGQPCSGGSVNCQAIPRVCTAAEIDASATCGAGQFPAGPTCQAAGSSVQLPGGALASAGLPQAASPAQAPPPEMQVVPPKALAPQADLQLCVASDQAAPACAGCSVGQFKDGNGACQPDGAALPAWCPQGFVASTAAVPTCAADPADCATDPFAGVADGPGHWFVDSQSAAEALGTRSAPFATVAQALAAAAAAGQTAVTIALAAGIHPLAAGKTAVPASVKIVGRCAHLTKLQAANSQAGSTLALAGQLEGIAVAGGDTVITAAAGAVVLRAHVIGGSTAALLCNGCKAERILISAQQRGIQVDKGTVVLDRVRIQESADRGLLLAGAATATLTDVVITDTKPTSKGTGGYAILLAEGATASGQGVRITGASAAGIAAFDAGTAAHLSRVWISGTKASLSSGEGGHGALATGGGRLHFTHARISGNLAVGVLSWGAGSQVHLLNSVVEATSPAPDLSSGDGLRAQKGGQLHLKACLIQANHTRGILVSGPGAALFGERLVIRDTLPRASDLGGGYGLWVEDGASATLATSRVQGNRLAGIGVAGKGSNIAVNGVEVLATLPSAKTGQGGYGLLAAEDASAQLAKVRLSANHAVGLWISDGALANAEQLVVDHTAALADLTLGRGIQVSAQASLTASNALIYANRDIGLLVDGAGTNLQLGSVSGAPSVVAAMQPRASDGGGGRALLVQGGAKAVVTGTHINGARELAVAASGADTSLALAHVWITETSPRSSDLLQGRAIAVEAGAKLAVAKVVILQAHEAGISVSGATLTGSDLWVDQTLPSGSTGGGKAQVGATLGRGMDISGKAKVQLARVRLSRNRDVALSVAHTGTVAEFTDLVIDGTLEEPATLEGGRGLQVIGGATAHVRGLWMENNKDIAVLIAQAGSALTGYDVRLLATQPEASQGVRGLGMAVLGAKVQLVGAQISGHRQHGIYSEYGQLTLVGAAIAATQGLPNGTGGQGVVASKGALELWGCQLKGHRGAALLAQLAQVTIERSAFLATQTAHIPGSLDLAADGLLLVDCLEALVRRALVAGNARAGIVLHGGSALVDGISLENNGFAWSVQATAQLVSNAAALVGNLQSAWTGPALQWFLAPVAAFVRPVLGSVTVDGAPMPISP